jgi:hypothetical protein
LGNGYGEGWGEGGIGGRGHMESPGGIDVVGGVATMRSRCRTGISRAGGGEAGLGRVHCLPR